MTESARAQSLGEEIANCITHGLGVLAALLLYPVLAVVAYQRGGVFETVAVSIFLITVIVLYLASTIFHALPNGRAKRVFRQIDHAAIYLLIAGTYTPFTLGVLRGTLGWTLFGIVWALACIGVILKLTRGPGNEKLSLALYLAMGWIALLVADKIWTLVPAWGLFWLLAGGLAYTIGTVFFALSDRVPYSHSVWHVFVLLGTSFHFVAVVAYSA